MAKKIEMLNDQQEVVHPLTSSDCVIMENGKTLEEVMGDGIATPTVTHEGASFQVGVGDSNIEVVDGDVAGMTLEGQTYQNILPKPTTLIMETDEKEFKINDKIDNNIVLDDNIAEIATVKGQTYVNVVQEESATEYTILGEELSGQSITTTGKPEGVIKNATLEGMTLVNTIQEPSEANSVVLDLDADINAQSVTINNTVQGGIHGATLKGQTLVNTTLKEHYIALGGRVSTAEVDAVFKTTASHTKSTATVTGAGQYNAFISLRISGSLLKPNTSYFVRIGEYTNTKGLTIINAKIKEQANVISTYTKLAENTFKVTTNSSYTTGSTYGIVFECSNWNQTYEVGDSWSASNIVVVEYIEGMENWDIPYFDGMQSVEVPSVKTTGKNLFDINKLPIKIGADICQVVDGVIHSNPQKPYDTVRWIVPVEPNTTYTLSAMGSSDVNLQLSNFYNTSDSNIDVVLYYRESARQSVTFTTTTHTSLTMSLFSALAKELVVSDIQLEEGTQATPYEPYKSSTVTIGNILQVSGGYTNGYIDDNGTVFTTNTDFYTNDYTPIQPNMKLTTNATNLYYYDENKNWVGRARQLGFTTPTNAKYIKAQWGATQGITINDLWVRENVALRKVGDVQDELDLETGKLTQRIGEVIVDNNKNWDIHTINQNTILFASYGCIPTVPSDDLVTLSDKYVIKKGFPELLASDEEQVHAYQDRAVYIRVLRTKLPSQNVDGLKQWLSNNPFTIQYKEKTPIVKTISTTVKDQSNNQLKTIQTQPTLTHITTSSNGLTPFISIPNQLKYPTIIKPSTQYTLKLKRDVIDSANQLTVNVGGVSTSITSNVMTITTPDALTSQDIVFTGKNNVISKLQLIEGDVTGIDYPYFEGMSDVKSPKLLATGKNLVAKTKKGAQDSNGNIIDSNRGLASIDLIKIKNGSTYVLSGYPSPSESYAYALFDKNKNYLNMAWGELLNPIDGVSYVRPFILYNTDMDLSDAYMQLEEGTQATSYEPYKGVTIEQDVDSIPLTSSMFVQGRLDINTETKSRHIGFSYQQIPVTTNTDTNRIRPKSLIKVKPNTTYETIATGITYSGVSFFDKDGLFRNVIAVGSNNSFTTEHDTEYIVPTVKRNDDSAFAPSHLDSLNLTLQEVPQEIVLRSLPNGVKDTLNLTTGEYIQRIGEVVLDGSQEYIISNTPSDTTLIRFSTKKALDNAKVISDSNSTTHYLTDKFLPHYDWNTMECAWVHYNNRCANIVIRRDKLSSKDVNGFKTYLASNPVTIQYILETPIIHKVNLTNTTKLPSYNLTTHYDTILPSNSLIPNIKLPSTIDYNVAIKPSTEYTVRCNTTNALSVDLGGSTGTLANGKVVLTTPSTLAHNSLKLGSSGKAKEVMVIEGNEIKDNVPFFNGMKNVQMGGIKLINIARGATCNSYVTANANKTQFTYIGDGSSEWGYIKFDSTLLKPNTKYTIYMNIITITSDNSLPIKVECGHDKRGYTDIAQTGIFKKAITTIGEEDGFNVNGFKIAFRPCTSGGKVVIQNPMIIEGDWTHLDEIPFIESEMIIEQPIIRSQGKNLCNIPNQTLGTSYGVTIKSIDGKINISGTPNNTYSYVTIPNFLQPNKKYTYSVYENGTLNKNYRLWVRHDDGGVLINPISGGTFITRSTNISMVQFVSENLESGVNINKDVTIQIEEGSVATTYEPFKHQTLYSNRVIGYEENCFYGNGGGVKTPNTGVNSMLADIEGLSIAYVVGGSSNFTFWDKDDVFISGKAFLDTALSSYDKNGFIQVPSNAKYMRFASGNETTSNTYKTATVTGELPLRSLPNGVCDTLNLVTGEYVQRVGDVVLDGSSDEAWIDTSKTANNNSRFGILNFTKNCDNNISFGGVLCNYYPIISAESTYREMHGVSIDDRGSLFIYDKIYGVKTLNDYKTYLSQNPITVQYELATPIVRKIGLTAKGNYKEADIVPNHYQYESVSDRHIRATTSGVITPYPDAIENSPIFSQKYHVRHYPTDSHGDYQYIALISSGVYINIPKNEVSALTTSGCREWLSLNPIKIGYITTAQSATSYSNILKPIFFNNVNVQFMNNNIDIQPILTLQARSRNSYVMHMMKPNTLYTSKFLQSGSGSTFIDGTVISVKPNNTFTSPSTLTNKLMITPLNRQELMIIEGDVTGLTIPYYKGIRSSFDNTHNIEVLSQTRNLFNYELHKSMEFDGTNFVMLNAIWDKNNIEYKLKPNTKYTLRLKTNDKASWIHIAIDGDNTSTNIGGFTDGWTKTFTTNSTGKVTIGIHANTDSNVENTLSEIQLEEGSVAIPYQPHEENTTIINMPTQLETVEVVKPNMEMGAINNTNGQECASVNGTEKRLLFTPVLPKEILTFRNGTSYRAMNVHFYDINKNFIKYQYTSGTGDLVVPESCYFIRGFCRMTDTHDLTITKKQYKPIALNELPNGVKDELIINRATSSAKLIQRVGKVVLDGSENYSLTIDVNKQYTFFTIGNIQNAKPCKTLQGLYSSSCYCDKLPIGNAFFKQETGIPDDGSCIGIYEDKVRLHLHNVDTNKDSYVRWVQENKPTIYYELAEPVITEISLKGYPYVYKDGSVQLNTEIPHTTKVKYNVNQEHLINGQNETIIRHDKQIDNLYDYIELYLEEEYRMELFRMQLELSL